MSNRILPLRQDYEKFDSDGHTQLQATALRVTLRITKVKSLGDENNLRKTELLRGMFVSSPFTLRAVACNVCPSPISCRRKIADAIIEYLVPLGVEAKEHDDYDDYHHGRHYPED